MGGWLEKVKLKLNSTQIVVEVEVRVELGKSFAVVGWVAQVRSHSVDQSCNLKLPRISA